jgi:hypothetical protein
LVFPLFDWTLEFNQADLGRKSARAHPEIEPRLFPFGIVQLTVYPAAGQSAA